MIHFDQEFLSLVRNLEITMIMYLRYIDDVDVTVKSLPKGTVYDKTTKKLIKPDDDNKDDLMDSEDMMTLLKNIANDIIPMISWEPDWETKYPDNKLPVLDLKTLQRHR